MRVQAAEAVNPFEMRFTRKKHDVLGQRIKGQNGSRGRSRDAAITKRTQTLVSLFRFACCAEPQPVLCYAVGCFLLVMS